jgi:hypothetical protein
MEYSHEQSKKRLPFCPVGGVEGKAMSTVIFCLDIGTILELFSEGLSN